MRSCSPGAGGYLQGGSPILGPSSHFLPSVIPVHRPACSAGAGRGEDGGAERRQGMPDISAHTIYLFLHRWVCRGTGRPLLELQRSWHLSIYPGFDSSVAISPPPLDHLLLILLSNHQGLYPFGCHICTIWCNQLCCICLNLKVYVSIPEKFQFTCCSLFDSALDSFTSIHIWVKLGGGRGNGLPLFKKLPFLTFFSEASKLYAPK